MTLPPRPAPGAEACASCDAPLAADQHWCVICGARHPGPRTDAIALLLGAPRPPAPPTGDAGPLAGAAARGAARAVDPVRRRRAALPVALAALVGLVVVTGANVPASVAGIGQPRFTVVLPAAAPAPAPVAHAPEPVSAPAPVDDAPADDALPLDDEPAAVAQEPAAEEPVEEPVEQPAAEDPPAAEEPETSPIQHVFVVVLGATDVAALAQDRDAAPYLAGTLAPSGTLLTDYRTVARGGLANAIALVSGQGPTAQTLADCAVYGDVRPAEPLADGQVSGDGCVYGYETGTIGDQLRGLEKTWRAYVEPATAATPPATAPPPPATTATSATPPPSAAASTATPTPPPTTDATPAPAATSATDATTVPAAPTPTPTDAAPAPTPAPATTPTPTALACDTPDATRRDPFLWFRGILEADDCDERNVPLERLARDLVDADRTPALSYVTSAASPGSAAADAFLERVVPQILNSPAYSAGGLVVITSDQAPQPPSSAPDGAEPPPVDPGPTAVPAPGPTAYPNVGNAAQAGAGARVGALLISPFTPAGRTDATPASHFTLLRTLSDLFGVDPLGYAASEAVKPLPRRLFDAQP